MLFSCPPTDENQRQEFYTRLGKCPSRKERHDNEADSDKARGSALLHITSAFRDGALLFLGIYSQFITE